MGDRQERGQTTTEMALLVALCGLLVIVAIVFFRTSLSDVFRSGQKATGAFRPPVSCDVNYAGGCVPPHPPDVDCADLAALGISQVTVTGSDLHGLDPDGDGIGCG